MSEDLRSSLDLTEIKTVLQNMLNEENTELNQKLVAISLKEYGILLKILHLLDVK